MADLERIPELVADEEPTAAGTLFLMLILLMLIAGVWSLVYQTVLAA